MRGTAQATPGSRVKASAAPRGPRPAALWNLDINLGDATICNIGRLKP